MSEKILLVDDEPLVLEGLRRHLGRKFVIETATSGREGLERLDKSGPFVVVMSDMRMPEMDGTAFLAEVRKRAPETVRIILSGQADLQSTIAAVNAGQIFRFLTKPCSGHDLLATLEAGIEQYRLVTARQELLEKTLYGTVKMLTEILALTNPAAHKRAARIERHVRAIFDAIEIELSWELRLATMLSQIGCITLPEEILASIYTGQELSAEADALYASHPQLAGQLLGSIPRLERVAAIVAQQLEPMDIDNADTDIRQWEADRLGGLVLNLATRLDDLLCSGEPHERAIASLKRRASDLPAPLVAALDSLQPAGQAPEKQMVRVSGLRIGMVLDQHLVSTSGLCLVPKGQEITHSLLMRLQSIALGAGVQEPFRVNTAS